MAKRLYINLPIKDVRQSHYFFESLGFKFNPQFSDDKALCLILGDNFYGMFLKEEFFQTFTLKPLSLGKHSTEVLLSLQVNTKDEVNQMVDKAIKLGAQEYIPSTDNGFMYLRVFEDLDGHQWEISWMDEMYNWDDMKQ